MLPEVLTLTPHARQRLEERKGSFDYYNFDDLMKSNCKWYTKDDFLTNSGLYIHSLYVCRKAPKMRYLTDGNIEVVYDSLTDMALTVLPFKDKFSPIEIFLKGNKRSKKEVGVIEMKVCKDCESVVEKLEKDGICYKCQQRKVNARSRKQVYVPIKDLPENERQKILAMREAQQQLMKQKNEEKKKVLSEKATISSSVTATTETTANKQETSSSTPTAIMSSIFNEYCGNDDSISSNLDKVMNVIDAAKQFAESINTIANTSEEQKDIILNIDQILSGIEKKLQDAWINNDFNSDDDIKYKTFLRWKQVLGSGLSTYKKIYQATEITTLNNLISSNSSSFDNKKQEDINTTETTTTTSSELKRYQITTETVSTILNTRKQFTRVFMAATSNDAYKDFKKWLADRQLHENIKKTSIVELK